MTNIRLLPIVVMAVAALLVLKTIGLITNGGYVLSGVTVAQAAGGGDGGHGGTEGAVVEADSTVTPAGEPTLTDTSPVLTDPDPTLGDASADGHGSSVAAEHGADPAEGEHGNEAAADAAHSGSEAPLDHAADPAGGEHAVAPSSTYCVDADVTLTDDGVPPAADDGHGEAASADHQAAAADQAAGQAASFAQTVSADCLPSGDAVPMQVNGDGTTTALLDSNGASLTEQQLLERLAARRSELEAYEQDLALRASIVDAAEKRIEERAATLTALEAQIAALVDQREAMESGQFAGIVAMYEAMKPKDAANIFNNLEMDVLLRVAKTMSPRKMAPILAEMDAVRAQELTVQMAAIADQPVTEMTPEDLSALPQIVGQ